MCLIQAVPPLRRLLQLVIIGWNWDEERVVPPVRVQQLLPMLMDRIEGRPLFVFWLASQLGPRGWGDSRFAAAAEWVRPGRL